MLGWFKRTFGKKKDEPATEPVPAEPTVAERAEQLAPPAEVEAVVAAAEPTQSPEPAEVAAEPSGPAAGVEPEILPEAAIPEETEPAPEAAEPEIATAAGETGAAVQADREPEPEPEPEPAEVVAEADREAEPVAEVEVLAEAKPAAETEPPEAQAPAAEPEPAAEAEAAIEPEPEPEPEVTVEPEAIPEPAAEAPAPAPEEAPPAAEAPAEQSAPEEPASSEAPLDEVEASEEGEEIVPAPPISGRTQEKPAARSMFQRLQERLGKTRDALIYRLDRLFLGKKEIDQDLYEQLEEILITADLGVATTLELIDVARKKVKRDQLSDPQALKDIIRDQILAYIEATDQPAELVLPEEGPFVIMVVGVNGVGKTTTIGKIAAKFVRSGQSVLLVAADTFRAAAIDQLRIWGERVGVRVIAQKPGADPSSVVFDGLEYGVAHGVDVIIIDTAGRLHTSVNLMAELKKITRVIGKKMDGAPHEVMLVLDATTGQNGIAQAKMFHEAVGVTGLTLTKLDGTAKGGIVANVCREIRIPVRFIGIGEQLDDLRDFDAREFVEALFAGQPGGGAAGP